VSPFYRGVVLGIALVLAALLIRRDVGLFIWSWSANS